MSIFINYHLTLMLLGIIYYFAMMIVALGFLTKFVPETDGWFILIPFGVVLWPLTPFAICLCLIIKKIFVWFIIPIIKDLYMIGHNLAPERETPPSKQLGKRAESTIAAYDLGKSGPAPQYPLYFRVSGSGSGGKSTKK